MEREPRISPSHVVRGAGRRELLVFATAYLVYFGVRAVTEGNAATAVRNALHLRDIERALDVDWEAAVQRIVLGSRTLLDIANAIYMYGHWPVLIIGGALLFHLRRGEYYRLRNVCLLSGAMGLVVFALFPVAPPRLAPIGLIDTITTHAEGYRTVLPPSLVNEYAAMPSFHAGWNLVLGIELFRASRHFAVRAFAVAMPAGMAFSVVATANHFVLDVLAGAAVVIAALTLVRRMERRRARAMVAVGVPAPPGVAADPRDGRPDVPRRIRSSAHTRAS
jgi:membrane-associated phospholipid phosphatase